MSTLLGGVASASLCMQQAGWPELQSAAPLQVFYSLAAGLPVIMVAFAGNVIRVRCSPSVWLELHRDALLAGSSVPSHSHNFASSLIQPLPSLAPSAHSLPPTHIKYAVLQTLLPAAQGAARAVPDRLHGLALWLGRQDLRRHALPLQHVHW